jgi:hypothetical protein
VSLDLSGLPLSDACGEILTRIHDHGPQEEKDLVAAVRGRLALKERRVLNVAGTWERFTGELLDQLTERKLIRASSTGIVAGPEFELGKRLMVTARASVIVQPAAVRQQQKQLAQARLAIVSAAATLRKAGVAPAQLNEAIQALLEGRDVSGMAAQSTAVSVQVLPGVRYTPFLTVKDEDAITDIVAAGGGPRQIRNFFGFGDREMEHQATHAFQRALGRLEERLKHTARG